MKVNKDFELFKKTFTHYQDKFGLMGYKVIFDYISMEDCYADCIADLDGMMATVRLSSKVFKGDKDSRDFKHHAKHEALHLLIHRLYENALCRFSSKAEIRESNEEIVRKLEKLIQ